MPHLLLCFQIDNLILTSSAQVKISDFGSARHCEKSDTIFATAGTPSFMAPEMCTGAVYIYIYAYGSISGGGGGGTQVFTRHAQHAPLISIKDRE